MRRMQRRDSLSTSIRDAIAADFGEILRLNAASEHVLSPLTRERLELLHRQAACHRVVEAPAGLAAFLLAFREGSAYDSPNYRWFAARYDRFLYVDRIVVADAHRGHGLGRRLYTDLFRFARESCAPRAGSTPASASPRSARGGSGSQTSGYHCRPSSCSPPRRNSGASTWRSCPN
jgi:uncharacterized protein